MDAGRELDLLVIERVMEWHQGVDGKVWWDKDGQQTGCLIDDLYYGPADVMMKPAWSPSIDIADAWKVVEKMHTRPEASLRIWNGVCHHLPLHLFTSAQAAHAICLASLEVVDKEDT